MCIQIIQVQDSIIGGQLLFLAQLYQGIIKIQSMGKKHKKQSTYATAQTFKIRKDKSLMANLNQYIKLLKAKYSDISAKQYIRLIHQYIYKLTKKKGSLPQSFVVKTKNKIKICKKCDKWAMGSEKIIQCQQCEDYYHIQCSKNYKQTQDWKCQSCITEIGAQNSEKKEQEANLTNSCKKCKQNKNQVKTKCLKCSNIFHRGCLIGLIPICNNCDKVIKSHVVKEKQLTLGESFKISEISNSGKKHKSQLGGRDSEGAKITYRQSNSKSKKSSINQQQKVEKQIDQSTNNTIVSKYKNFLNGFPKMTSEEIQKYKSQLIYAIESKNMKYSRDLIYQNCSPYQDNQDSLDFALAHMSPSDLKMYNQYKKQPIGPLSFTFKETCGYDVIADKDLPKGMIVCQYVGDVYTHRAFLKLKQSNDSVMQLKIGKNADQSLLIVPRKHTNIARFINGVNERDPKKSEKQNIGTFRALAKGQPVVLLYTTRLIRKGESLMYNYGLGGVSAKYDTSHYQ